jgi:hypothetical protein
LAAAFLAVFFAAFLWSLRLGNSRSLEGNTTRAVGRNTRATSGLPGTVVGDPGTRPDATGARG